MTRRLEELSLAREGTGLVVANGGITDEQESEVWASSPERQLRSAAARGLVPPRLALSGAGRLEERNL